MLWQFCSTNDDAFIAIVNGFRIGKPRQVPVVLYPIKKGLSTKLIPVISPEPEICPEIDKLWLQMAFFRIEQSSVTLILKLKFARISFGFAGKGSVPKSQTTDPFEPNDGSK